MAGFPSILEVPCNNGFRDSVALLLPIQKPTFYEQSVIILLGILDYMFFSFKNVPKLYNILHILAQCVFVRMAFGTAYFSGMVCNSSATF